MLAILLSALFASCKDEIEEEADPYNNTTKKEILSFSTYTSGATRATELTSDLLKEKGFQVAAWYDGKLYFNADESAKYTEDIAGNRIFDTQGATYYWPSFSAGNIGFRAFNLDAGATWKETYKSIAFTVADKASAQKDLVIAYAEAASKPDKGVQPLNFIHALSKINFTFDGIESDLTYTINKVEVIAAGLPSGTNTNTFASFVDGKITKADADLSAVVKWDYNTIVATDPLVKKNDGAKAAQGVLYTYYDGDGIVAGTGAATMKENLMLLPQDGRIAVRVYYKVENNGELIGNCGYYATDEDGNHNKTNAEGFNGIRGCKTVLIDLQKIKLTDPTPAIPEWQTGKSYRFTLSLPKDNFIGDKNGDGNADDEDEDGNDLDGDGDAADCDPEFGDEEGGFIEFSVKVALWDEDKKNVNIVID